MRRCETRDSALKPGVAVKLTHPVSDDEKDLVKKGLVDFIFVRFIYARAVFVPLILAECHEKGSPNNSVWILHLKSLSVEEGKDGTQ